MARQSMRLRRTLRCCSAEALLAVLEQITDYFFLYSVADMHRYGRLGFWDILDR